MLAAIRIVFYIATVIVFLVWFYRVHANQRPLSAEKTTYSSGWAVGFWFVPILNLVRPVQIAQEIWRNSNPDSDASGNSPLVGLWWAMWLVCNVANNIAARMMWNSNTPASLQAGSAADMIAGALTALATLLAFAVVSAIDARQNARAYALGLAVPEDYRIGRE